MVPITPRLSHEQARSYCKVLAQKLAVSAPKRYTLSPDPEMRQGRLYMDYLRNGRGTTAVGAYSPRVREGFPVPAPVTWKEVEAGVVPDAYSMSRLPRRR
jgi:bifunctional non-homologous end joining protein LigD